MIFNLFLVTKQQNGRPSGRGGCLPGQTVPRIQRPVVKNIKVTAKQAWLRDGKTGLTNDMTLKKYQPERADLLINTNSIVDMRWQPIAPMVRRNVFCVNLLQENVGIHEDFALSRTSSSMVSVVLIVSSSHHVV